MSWSKTNDAPRGVAARRKKSLGAALALCTVLATCGFHPRGAATLPFSTMYVDAPKSSPFALQLRRAIGSGSSTRVTNTAADADLTLQVLNEFREQEILSLSPGGRAREIQLRYRVQYQAFDRSKAQVLAPSEIVLRRDFSLNDQDPRGQEGAQELLYRDMQADAVQQLVRRLQAAAKTQPKT
jgi:LPS-assembly lipoprotein